MRRRHRPCRPRLALAGLLFAALTLPPPARADAVPVPVALQADLLFAVAAQDRNLPARAAGTVRTLILTRKTDESIRAALRFRSAAVGKAQVGGLPHVVEVTSFASGAELAEAVKTKHVAIVYLTPGFTEEDAAEIARALEGGSVLTVSAAPALVGKGAVLGFDLVSGRAKLVVDLTRATRQQVAFSPDVLGLMAVHP